MFQFYLYPLKTLENLWFSNFFKGYANGILAQDRLKELEQFFFLGFITKVHCCSIWICIFFFLDKHAFF